MRLIAYHLLLLGLAAPGLTLASAPESTAPTPGEAKTHAFAALDEHYQAMRLSLLVDSTEGVSEGAKAIARIVSELKAAPSAGAAGVPEGSLASLEELLPLVLERAETLAAARTLTAQREALKKLSQPLVRWHELVTGPKPRIAYCSMERGAWLQPDGVLGNPYGGKRMPRCGSFIDS